MLALTGLDSALDCGTWIVAQSQEGLRTAAYNLSGTATTSTTVIAAIQDNLVISVLFPDSHASETALDSSLGDVCLYVL